MRAALLAAVLFFSPLVAEAQAPQGPITLVPGTNLAIVPGGGASGGDALYCNYCDAIGWRNIQGGGFNGEPLDIGAGSTAQPSDVAINWDIGKAFKVYDGHKHLIMRVGASGIDVYGKIRVHRRPGKR